MSPNILPGHFGNFKGVSKVSKPEVNNEVLEKMNDTLVDEIREEYHEVPDRRGVGRFVKVKMIPMGYSGRDYKRQSIRSHTIRGRNR